MDVDTRDRRRARRGREKRAGFEALTPNRLSIELRPNRLSILEGPARPAVSLRPQASEPSPPSDRAPALPRAGARRPRFNLSTLLFIAFIGFWLLSRIGEFLPGSASSTSSPRPAAVPSGVRTPIPTLSRTVVPIGQVELGTRASANCTVSDQRDTFAAGSEVWWSAAFGTALQAHEQVRWMILLDGRVLDQTIGPSTRPSGPWNVLCGDDPLTFDVPGIYRLRFVHTGTGDLLAEATFTIESR